MLRVLHGLTLIGTLLQAVGVFAAGFSVSPVRVELSQARPMMAISVTNAGDADIVVQSELLRWSQAAEKDVYEPTDMLIVNPPIFRIKPKTTQVIRVGLRGATDASRETTYRLFLAEVPGAAPKESQGLRLALRVGLPIFVNPPVKASPALQWVAKRNAADGVALELRNTGNAHVQLKDVKLTTDDSKVISEKMMAVYVLAGETRQWKFTIDPAWRGAKVRLSARTDADDVDMDLPLQKP